MILGGQCGAFSPILLQCLQEISDTLENELADTLSEHKKERIQDIRSKIDYNRMFAREKYISPFREHQYLQLLYVDSLTNVYNRRYYDECIKDANNSEALAVIDVNNFKQINDNFGHAAGDSVLQSIAKTITSCVRKTDAVIRYGGDEFVIIFNSIPTDIFEKKPKNQTLYQYAGSG